MLDIKLLQFVIRVQPYPGVAVILYLMTDEFPFSPQMRALTGLGVIIGLLIFSGVLSTAGIWSFPSSFLPDADEMIETRNVNVSNMFCNPFLGEVSTDLESGACIAELETAANSKYGCRI